MPPGYLLHLCNFLPKSHVFTLKLYLVGAFVSVIILMMLCLETPDYHIRDTELFQVMQFDEVFVTPSGEVYVLNFNESRIQYYGADGELKKNIGRRGQGPGEFTFPVFFSVVDQKIFVRDILTNLITIFDADGNYLHQITTPTRELTMSRGTGGWFFWTEEFGTELSGPSTLFLANDTFEERKLLAKIPDLGWDAGINSYTSNGKVTMTFAPVATRYHLEASKDGKKIYYADPNLFKIQVFDGATGKLIQTITKDDPRLPFDNDWADERINTSEAHSGRSPGQAKITKFYPKYFPMIRSLAFDPVGNLVVDRWRGKPDENNYPIAFNAEGQEVPLNYSWEVIRRFAGSALGYGYIIMYEEDDDSGLCKVPLAHMEALVKAHPITDWQIQRGYSISN